MIKKILERQFVFNILLHFLAFFAKRKIFRPFTCWATHQLANLNLYLNKPQPANDVAELAKTWQELMPPDGQAFFKIAEVKDDTAYTEIHLQCPLRGTKDVEACYQLMNYDRKLMEAVGGQLIVLESQSNSGREFCRLAIRKKGQDTSDLIPAHLKEAPGEFNE